MSSLHLWSSEVVAFADGQRFSPEFDNHAPLRTTACGRLGLKLAGLSMHVAMRQLKRTHEFSSWKPTSSPLIAWNMAGSVTWLGNVRAFVMKDMARLVFVLIGCAGGADACLVLKVVTDRRLRGVSR